MNLSRCPSGHFYDAGKHKRCPHCQSDAQIDGYAAPYGDGAARIRQKGDRRARRGRGEKGAAPRFLASEQSVKTGLAGLVEKTFDALGSATGAVLAARQIALHREAVPAAEPYGAEVDSALNATEAVSALNATEVVSALNATEVVSALNAVKNVSALNAAKNVSGLNATETGVTTSVTAATAIRVLPANARLSIPPLADSQLDIPAFARAPSALPPAVLRAPVAARRPKAYNRASISVAEHSWRPRAEQPVVGWLVCVEGSCPGVDFRLRAGRNYIGRSSEMDISIPGDIAIARDRHASVVYDPTGLVFVAVPGESRELSYLNGFMLLAPSRLACNDVLTVGETKLVFVPLCGERFSWGFVGRDQDQQ